MKQIDFPARYTRFGTSHIIGPVCSGGSSSSSEVHISSFLAPRDTALSQWNRDTLLPAFHS
ncbi:uncharacterized protein LOC112552946 isoform X4 [Pogonomyrmex barbatus]|uniref:Uncharacterized protein LOC112552946 isoform X4 n=1 Tax=Pogonomyrmex barbatus TaxID=144034 RepID=A0A8N1S8W4_9HYME|nr:uncharacterized protein LOC112552946 isoform X4 [Pogonomyrmex barbatus]